MKQNITREFKGAAEKGLEVFYNDNTGCFEIETVDEVMSWSDEENETEDGSNGEARRQVEEFIAEF